MNRRLLKLGAVGATALSLAACGIMPNPLAPQQEELSTEQSSSSRLVTKATSPMPANTHPQGPVTGPFLVPGLVPRGFVRRLL